MHQRKTVRRLSRTRRHSRHLTLRWRVLSFAAVVALILQTSASGVFLAPRVIADADTDVTLAPAPLVTVEKTVSNLSNSDPYLLYYTIVVTNSSAVDLEQPQIDDVVPAALSYVANSSGYSLGPLTPADVEPTSQIGGMIHWDLPGIIPAGMTGTLVFQARASAIGNDYPGFNDGKCSITNSARFRATTMTGAGTIEVISEPAVYDQPCPSVYYDPDLVVTKSIVAGSHTASSVQYRLDYENIGDWPAFNPTVSDVIPTGLTNAVIVPTPTSFDGSTATWELGTLLDPAETGSLTYTLSFDELAECRTLTNGVSIAQDLSRPLPTNFPPYEEVVLTNNNDAVVSDLIGACRPSLALTKTDGQDTIAPGTTLTYTLAWTVSTDEAPALVVRDTLPAGVTFVSASGAGTYDAVSRTVAWQYGLQTPGATGTETVTVTTDAALTNGTVLTNTASLTGYQNDTTPIGDPVIATDATSIVVAPPITEPPVEPQVAPPPQPVVTVPAPQAVLTAPVLTLEKTADRTTATPNDRVTYTIVVKNTGNETARNLTLQDTLPTGMSFSDVTGSSRTWNLGVAFPAGGSTTITYAAVIGDSVAPGTLTNTATLTAENHATVTDTASLTVERPVVRGAETTTLKLVKRASVDRVNPGGSVDYTLIVTNTGLADAVNVVVKDFLPDGILYADDAASMRTWTLGNLRPGRSTSLTYTALVEERATVGSRTNVAEASFDNGDPVVARAVVDVQAGVVLGAATELAATGAGFSDVLAFVNGGLLVALAVVGLRRSYQLA